nr:MAG TPA_asm: hypothetical protein [Caudoviricetes sp.]
MPETTFKKFAKTLSFSETIVYTYYVRKGNGKRHIPSRDRPSLRIPERKESKCTR